VKAVILAAGLSSRLGTHTATLPKGLVPLDDSTCLDRTVSICRELNLESIAVVIGYCADVMRRHFAGSRVTLIENVDYATTNSVFSLWCARHFVDDDPDGFVVVNSDLIFKAGMLRALVDAPVPDGMIVDRTTVDFTSDMCKIELSGERIVRISKKLEPSRTSAEAVGPVKFSQAGGRQFFRHIRAAIDNGRRNEWFFYALSDFAREHAFHAVQNPGLPWAEVDTGEDLELALKKIRSGLL
jgi:choline kinase